MTKLKLSLIIIYLILVSYLLPINRDYYIDCSALNKNFENAKFEIANIMTDNGIYGIIFSLEAVISLLQDKKFDDCKNSENLWHLAKVIRDLYYPMLEAEQYQIANRTVYILFDEDIEKNNLQLTYSKNTIQKSLVEIDNIFRNELDIDIPDNSIFFYITDERVSFDDEVDSSTSDLGGFTIGSIIVLPLEEIIYNEMTSEKILQEDIVSHEIVHVLTNQIINAKQKGNYPLEFTEGMALYLADNKLFENKSQFTSFELSKEYKSYLCVFEYLDKTIGRKSTLSFIRNMLTNPELDFFEELSKISNGKSYKSLARKGYWKLEKKPILTFISIFVLLPLVFFSLIVLSVIWSNKRKKKEQEYVVDIYNNQIFVYNLDYKKIEQHGLNINFEFNRILEKDRLIFEQCQILIVLHWLISKEIDSYKPVFQIFYQRFITIIEKYSQEEDFSNQKLVELKKELTNGLLIIPRRTIKNSFDLMLQKYELDTSDTLKDE